MSVVEINSKAKEKRDSALIKKVAEKFLSVYKKGGQEVSIAFVGDKTMRRLNRTYRKIDRPTDVLTFSGEGPADDGASDFFGEIIIDREQIKRQAKKYGKTEKEELVFILVHGLLHLAGYNDETEKGRLEMTRLGIKFIGTLKIPKL